MSITFNPFTGNFDIKGGGTISSWKQPVANFAALPGSGNTTGDCRLTLDTFDIYAWNGSAWIYEGNLSSSGASFTDNAIARWDGTDGQKVQNSLVTIDDSGNVSTAGNYVKTNFNNNRILLSSSNNISEASALTNGQLLIGNTGNAPTAASIAGTTDQISVSNGAGSITLSTPQNIATTSSPTFAGLTLTAFSGVVKASVGVLSASSIVNADISNSAAIDITKIANGTANQLLGVNSGATANEWKSLSVGTSGTDFAISHAANSIVFNLPTASAANRGVVDTSAQEFSGVKTFNNIPLFKLGIELEDPGAGSNKVGIKAGTVSSSYDITVPTAVATVNNSALISNTSGVTTWNQVNLASQGDINETSFTIANNTVSPSSVTNFAFSNGTVRSFEAIVSVYIDATTPLYEQFKVHGIQKASDWVIDYSSVGDTSQIALSITSAGQIQYTSGNYTGFVSGTMKFRAITTSI